MEEVFAKPQIEVAHGDLIAFFTVRNEIQRLPYFFEYYRKQGVRHFFAIDNNSDDGTTEFLKNQHDVHYFFTENSYVSSKAGRLWTTELANHYGNGRWCLTLDVDELLVFPGVEELTIAEITEYMDVHGFEALFTIFLDMYSDKPLSQAVYESGEPFLDTCRYFEKDTYKFHLPQKFPPVQIFGGPRQRQFWDRGGAGNGPSMRKLPLVRWRNGIHYYHSTHSISPLLLADFTGALLHFKFFASFEELARKEVERGDRMQMADYRKYLEKIEAEDLQFHRPESIKYEDSLTLLTHGVITTSKKFINFIGNRVKAKSGKRRANLFLPHLTEVNDKAFEKTPELMLGSLPRLWPFVSSEQFFLTHDKGIKSQTEHMISGRLSKKYHTRLTRMRTLEKTRPLREWLYDRDLLSPEYMPERTKHIDGSVEGIVHIYESLWWDLGIPLRLFDRIKKAIYWKKLLSRKWSSQKISSKKHD